MKNCNDTLGNRTHGLPTCSAVPQPTAPPRTPIELGTRRKCCPSVTSFTVNPARTCLGLNSVLCGETSATNRLIHGTPLRGKRRKTDGPTVASLYGARAFVQLNILQSGCVVIHFSSSNSQDHRLVYVEFYQLNLGFINIHSEQNPTTISPYVCRCCGLLFSHAARIDFWRNLPVVRVSCRH